MIPLNEMLAALILPQILLLRVSLANPVLTRIAGGGPLNDPTNIGSGCATSLELTAASALDACIPGPSSVSVFNRTVYFSVGGGPISRVYKITAFGGLITVAGSSQPDLPCTIGVTSGPGDGGLATSAQLCSPNGFRVDLNGEVHSGPG